MRKHKRVFYSDRSEGELPEFVGTIRGYDKSPLVKEGLELLLMTAVGPGELRMARWEAIDLEAAVWKIPVDRMKMGLAHRRSRPTRC